MKKFKLALSTLAATAALMPVSVISTSCSSSTTTLDYSKEENWIYKKYNPNPLVYNYKYDVIFFVGTSVVNPTQSDGVGLNREEQIPGGLENYNTCGSQICNKANVFVPLYSQISLNHALDTCTKHNDLIDQIRNKQPKKDLMAFMDYYFTTLNPKCARPFILAGHSQGSASLQVVLEDYFIKGGHKEYLKNMIAAYSTGYGVSKKWFDGLDKKVDGKDVIHFAQNEDDTNCLLSWNIEGPDDESFTKGASILLPDDKNDTYLINPLNWKTDNTVAAIHANTGVLVEDEYSQSNAVIPSGYHLSWAEEDLLDAQIDTVRGSVICTTKKQEDYVNIPGRGYVWGGRSLHLFDGKGYYTNIMRNAKHRVVQFFNK